jgi:hypothetical protein
MKRANKILLGMIWILTLIATQSLASQHDDGLAAAYGHGFAGVG